MLSRYTIASATWRAGFFALVLMAGIFCGAGEARTAGGPRLGEPGQGAVIDKSGDVGLQELIRDVLPRFKQSEYKNGGMTLQYNIFEPLDRKPGKKYPLVLFMADASTPGKDVQAPLAQGYGALVWAAREAQAKHPCYVLVPQFSGVAVNDSYERTPEVEAVLGLLKEVVKSHDVDTDRIYSTGQSMGGMISMYYNITNPDIFAASIFVDCHWDNSGFDQLVLKPFVFIYAGDKGKGWHTMRDIEVAARKMSIGYTWSEWSARLPMERQDALAMNQLEKGEPINLIGFENGTVLPASGKGSEHMYSFDYAYKLAPVRDWLFGHSLAHKDK